jgi:YVTN family beta-propeller protein
VIDTSGNTVITTINVGRVVDGVVVTPDSTTVYVTNEDTNTVSVIDAGTNTVTGTISVGAFPVSAAISPDGARLYVTNESSNTVSVVQTSTNTVIDTIAVGMAPYGVALTPDGTKLYVANRLSNVVSVLNTADDSLVTTIPVGNGPRSLGLFIGGPFVATATATPTITATPTGTQTVTSTPTGTSTDTPTPTVTSTSTGTATETPTPTGTTTGTPTDTASSTPTQTQTLTQTPTDTTTSTPTASPSPVCAVSPLSGCRSAGTSILAIAQGTDSMKRKLAWRWNKGAATDLFALGNPVTSTNYALCVYGSNGGVPSVALAALATAGSMCGTAFCWTSTGTSGFMYRDAGAHSDGLTRIILRKGTAGRAKVLVRAKGTNLPGITPADANNLIRQDPSVTVQLVNSAGECWESVYASPATTATGAQFRDKF